MPLVSIAEAKSHFSELIAKCVHARERMVITRRRKPVAAIVSLEDLQIIEQYEERQGLASIAGKWDGFEEVAEPLEDLNKIRHEMGEGRDVSF